MTAQLKLVVDNTPSPRPYATYYYGSPRDAIGDWVRIGRAASPIGAVHAAVKHLLLGRADMAVVHGVDGEIMFRLTRHSRKIEIFGLFSQLVSHG